MVTMANNTASSSSRSNVWKGAVLAALVAWLLYGRVVLRRERITFRDGAAYPAVPRPAGLTEQEKADFYRDGFILKKGVVQQGEELRELVEAGEKLYSSFSVLDSIFAPSFAKLSTQVWREIPAFARLAMESSLPSITAELMQMHNGSIRILKDGFFGFKGVNNTGCGFHVDDKGFWPADDASGGVNFWLALSPMRIAEGGGIRVVNQSSLPAHVAESCKQVIRDGGGFNYSLTCRMEQLSPTCHEQMMAASVVYDMEAGDALIWDRWTFHRSEPFVVESDTHKLRYTIRYVPGTARAQGMVHETQKVGDVFNSPSYPQVWPSAIESEVDAIRQGIGSDFVVSPVMMLKVAARRLGLL
jgi:Phytanoyl-CoA dioxygenase (PhyH)